MSKESRMLNEIIENNFPQMLDRLAQIIKIPSIGGNKLPFMPYGRKCAEVLKTFLDIADDEGFYIKNYDNYVGTVEFNENPVKLGVLCHLDVVPVSREDWSYDPFGAQIDNGRMYGRGTIDDKGPAIAVLFAMKAIKDAGIELPHNVRFIVGCDEERGSSDLEYYMKKEKIPQYVFTPDGDYPVINIEKGMLRFRFVKEVSLTHIKSITGGTVVNAVPASAEAVLVNVTDLPDSDNISIQESDDGIHVIYKGSAAHASTPESGVNAITGLFDYLRKLELDQQEKLLFKSLAELFVHGDFYGKSLKINMKDEKSGSLTAVLSIISYDGHHLEMKMDIRYPVCGNKDDIRSKINSVLENTGIELYTDFQNDPHCVDENSEFVRTLLKVYHDQTGLDAYCKAIGGGTYVHDIENGVAFGAEFPGEENNMHGNDESVSLENLLLNTKIIANAIYEICR